MDSCNGEPHIGLEVPESIKKRPQSAMLIRASSTTEFTDKLKGLRSYIEDKTISFVQGANTLSVN